LFWGVGVTLIDAHIGVGIFLCIVGIAATVWIYWSDILQMSNSNFSKWPWLGMAVFFIEIAVPGYILLARADDAKPTMQGTTSTGQSGGQTGGIINNNGPVYNAPGDSPNNINGRKTENDGQCKTSAIRNSGTNNTIENNTIRGYKCGIDENGKNTKIKSNDIRQ